MFSEISFLKSDFMFYEISFKKSDARNLISLPKAMNISWSKILRGEKAAETEVKVALSKGSFICYLGASVAVAMVMRCSMQITRRGK